MLAGILTHGLPVVEGMNKPETVVGVLTGRGLKDSDTAFGKVPPIIRCANEIGAIEQAVSGREPDQRASDAPMCSTEAGSLTGCWGEEFTNPLNGEVDEIGDDCEGIEVDP